MHPSMPLLLVGTTDEPAMDLMPETRWKQGRARKAITFLKAKFKGLRDITKGCFRAEHTEKRESTNREGRLATEPGGTDKSSRDDSAQEISNDVPPAPKRVLEVTPDSISFVDQTGIKVRRAESDKCLLEGYWKTIVSCFLRTESLLKYQTAGLT